MEVQLQDCKKTGTEPDSNWSGPRIPRTGEDRNHSLVFGPSHFQKFEDQEKTGLTGLNQSLDFEELIIEDADCFACDKELAGHGLDFIL